ncbi:hypothetical protein BpHYR1_006777 [Brachionus plicatilis]|uniref:Uncharacterized protein n=1 Tax=Brachionus plicatilis TaxID=10195 RepID=A0A3M7SZ08_BRAPC|nr:hypothetical protein BpHYR1_006777 [Brachionus plicatilis]
MKSLMDIKLHERLFFKFNIVLFESIIQKFFCKMSADLNFVPPKLILCRLAEFLQRLNFGGTKFKSADILLNNFWTQNQAWTLILIKKSGLEVKLGLISNYDSKHNHEPII